MDIVLFTKDVIAANTVGGYISLACIGIFVICIAWHMLRGYRRGIARQAVHTGFALFAAVASYIASNTVWNNAVSLLSESTLQEVIEPMYPELFSYISTEIIRFIVLLPVGVLVMPVVFAATFFVLNLLFKILYLITIAIFHISKGESPKSKVPGLILGIVEGFIVASITLLPLAAISGIAEDTYTAVEATNEERGTENEDIDIIYDEYIRSFAENPILGLVDTIGSDLLLTKMASYEFNGTPVSFRDEFTSMAHFAIVDIPVIKNVDWMALKDNDKAAIDDIVDLASGSHYRASIIAELLGSLSQLLNIDENSSEDGSSDIFVAFFSVFVDLEPDSLVGVLDTYKKFYFLASDEGILRGLSDGDDSVLTDAFTSKDENGDTTLSKLVRILESNERTAVLVTSLTKMTITVLSDSMGLDNDAITKYNDIKGTINTAITTLDTTKTKEEQISDVSGTLSESFAANGMIIAPEVTEKMAENIVENYANGDAISDEEFNDIILSYYQANKDVIDSSIQ